MNYDFNNQELQLFVQLQEMMQAYTAAADPEKGDVAAVERTVRGALARLGETPYLNLGLLPQAGYNGMLTLMGAMEVLAGLSPSLFLSVEMSTRVFGRMVQAWGDPDQKTKWMAPLTAGRLIGAVGLSEEAMNVENEALKTTGSPDGDGVVINGRKQYVINGPIADWLAVAGVMDGRNALFLVEKNTKGLVLEERLATLGYEGAAICNIRLENCRIPKNQVVIPAEDRAGLDRIRLWENQVILGASIGLMKSAFEAARNYAKTHKSGGKPVIAFQEVGFKLSEMLTLTQTSQLFAYRAAWTAEDNPKEAESITLCAKVFCTEAAEQVAGNALQILSGAGYLTGNAVERAYRCAKYGQIAGTSTEIARVKIGDDALGARAA
ncbi:MAG: acyl-CoA dehydrogenase family protein [Thermodesulfobacteriota bacterium]